MLKIINRLGLEEAELYATIDNNRVMLARCNAKMELHEESENIKVMGSQNCKVKKRKFTIVLCDDMEYTRDVTIDILKIIRDYGLKFEVQREDGVFECFYIDGLVPKKIDIDGEWVFDVEYLPDEVKKLIY